jgi:hypothetical protein
MTLPGHLTEQKKAKQFYIQDFNITDCAGQGIAR